MQGGAIPESFLAGLVLLLRKNGDSDLAADYRPITLLQSCYKILAMILATRVQYELVSIVRETQQGFVKARLLERAVVVMQAVPSQAFHDDRVGIDESPMAVLLDFTKTYDTLSRSYILVVLQKFGFAPEFVWIIARLHQDTSAQFAVNGETSKRVMIRSGIRQGCPLAPLLFIIAVKPLSLMLKQDAQLQGIEVGGERPVTVIASTFVDDTAVFLKHGRMLPRLLDLLQAFEAISGLKVQPAKSELICLNKAVQQREHFGIRVLSSISTTRYLGIQVGHVKAIQASWSKRVAGICVRLAKATRVSTRVVRRVKIFNAIAFSLRLNSHTRQKQLLQR